MCVCANNGYIYIYIYRVCSGYAFGRMSDFETLPMLLYIVYYELLYDGSWVSLTGVEDNF